jgi:hypothetical protein
VDRRLTSRIGFGALGFFAGLLVINLASQVLGQGRPNRVNVPNVPQSVVSYPNAPIVHSQGVPAIKPSQAGAASTFTADDLRQFLTSNSAPLGTKGSANVTISRVECSLTAGQVSGFVHGKSFAVPPDTNVCYAEFSGDFSFPLPSRRAGQPASLTYHKSFRVYDAKTGNLLSVGAFE